MQIVLSQPAPDPVALRVGGQMRGILDQRRMGFLPVRPFAIYDVSIQPRVASNIIYDQSEDRVIAYPGNVIAVQRSVRPIEIFVGRLVDAAGRPISDAVLTGEDSISRTDAAGYFQDDGATGDALTAVRSDGASCGFVLPAPPNPGAVYVNAGELVCAASERAAR